MHAGCWDPKIKLRGPSALTYATGRFAAVVHGALRARDGVGFLGPCMLTRLRKTRHYPGFVSLRAARPPPRA
eukprot:279914-Prymnesium_polylepis.1